MDKESLIVILAIALFVVFIVWPAGDYSADAVNADSGSERITVSEKIKLDVGNYAYVLIDNDTGAQYLFVDSGYSGGLTKLEG